MITVNQIKKDSQFKDKEGNIYHILQSNISKEWNGAKGKLMYNKLNASEGIKAYISSIDKFKSKLPLLETCLKSELADMYNKLS